MSFLDNYNSYSSSDYNFYYPEDEKWKQKFGQAGDSYYKIKQIRRSKEFEEYASKRYKEWEAFRNYDFGRKRNQERLAEKRRKEEEEQRQRWQYEAMIAEQKRQQLEQERQRLGVPQLEQQVQTLTQQIQQLMQQNTQLQAQLKGQNCNSSTSEKAT